MTTPTPTDLPPDTAERLAEQLPHMVGCLALRPPVGTTIASTGPCICWTGRLAVANALLPTVAQLVAERTEALEASLASDRRRLLDELHMLGVVQDEQAKLADARAEGAAEALDRAAALLSDLAMERDDGALEDIIGSLWSDAERHRAAAIRQGGQS